MELPFVSGRANHPSPGLGGQMARFALAGALCTVIYASVYLPLAYFALPPGMAVAAVPPAFLVSLVAGYLLNSRWSFRGHGERDAPLRRSLRFGVTQVSGFGLNLFFTWAATAFLALPNWTALVPIVLVTPLLTFALQRGWVFR